MKKQLCFFLILVASAITISGYAQVKKSAKVNIDSLENVAKENSKIVLKTNPLHYAFGPLFLTGEARVLGEIQSGFNSSIELGASYLYKGVLFEEFVDPASAADQLSLSGWRGQFSYRYFFLNKPLYNLGFKSNPTGITGFYIAPHISYLRFVIEPRNTSLTGNHLEVTLFDISASGGLQMAVEPVYLDMYFGLGYKDNSFVEVMNNQVQPVQQPEDNFIFDSNFKIRIGFNIGISL